MPRYLRNLGAALWRFIVEFDRLCNVILGGAVGETFSSRVGRAMRVTTVTKWVELVPWPNWLKRHFLTTDDRAPK